MAATLLAAGVPQSAISVIPDEQAAIDAALRMGRQGDLLLVFSDALVRSWKQIIYFRPEGAAGAGARPAARRRAHRRGAGRIRGAALARGTDPRRARHPLRAGGVRLSESASALGRIAPPDRPQPVLRRHGRRARDGRARSRACSRPGECASSAPARSCAGPRPRPRPCRTSPAPRSRSRRPRTSCSPPPRSTNGRSRPRSRSVSPATAPALVAALAAEQPEETEPPVLETAGALLRLRRRAAREANPRLRALIEAAQSRRLPYLLDDDALTLGAGAGGHSWPIAELPEPAVVDWSALRSHPDGARDRHQRQDHGRAAARGLCRAPRATRPATAAPMACSSPAMRSAPATTRARPAPAACCATRTSRRRSSRLRAAASCGAGSRSRAPTSPSSPASPPIISASTACTTSRRSST